MIFSTDNFFRVSVCGRAYADKVLHVRTDAPMIPSVVMIEDVRKHVGPNLVFGTSGCFCDRRTDELKVFWAFFSILKNYKLSSG